MTLQHMMVGVVGCGGAGSAVAEQLLRLGVGRVVVVDPCAVDGDDLTRCYGTTQDDAARAIYRVDVVARLATALGRSEAVDAVIGDLDDPAVARRLARADMIFACDLTSWQRIALDRLAARHLLPVIDCAAALDAVSDKLDGALERLASIPYRSLGGCRPSIVDGSEAPDRRHDLAQNANAGRRRHRRDTMTSRMGRAAKPSMRTIPLDTIAAGVAVAAFLQMVDGGDHGAMPPIRPSRPVTSSLSRIEAEPAA